MNVKDAYNSWASQYDTNLNKTRDLEQLALQQVLGSLQFNNCLEIGCGTGKNSVWLIDQCTHLTAVDLSDEMLKIAKEKVNSPKASFKIADIKNEWAFGKEAYDLITFSLVLEHVNDLEHIFKEATKCLSIGGHIYIGELHPFKQYTGSKARFDTDAGTQIVECYNHHISDFAQTAKRMGLQIVDINEFFDDNNRETTPRILTLLFKKE